MFNSFTPAREASSSTVLAAILGSSSGADSSSLTCRVSDTPPTHLLASPAQLQTTSRALSNSQWTPSFALPEPENKAETSFNGDGLRSPFALEDSKSYFGNHQPHGLFSSPPAEIDHIAFATSSGSPADRPFLPGAFPTPPPLPPIVKETPDAPPPLQRVQDSLPRFPTPDEIRRKESLIKALDQSSPSPSPWTGQSDGTPELVFSSPLARSPSPEDLEAPRPTKAASKRKSFFGLRLKGRAKDQSATSPNVDADQEVTSSPVSPSPTQLDENTSPVDIGNQRPRRNSVSHRLSTIFKPRKEKNAGAPPLPDLPMSAPAISGQQQFGELPKLPMISRSQSTPDGAAIMADTKQLPSLSNKLNSRNELRLDLTTSANTYSASTPSTATTSSWPSSLLASSARSIASSMTLPDTASDGESVSDCGKRDSGVLPCHPARTAQGDVEILKDDFHFGQNRETDFEILNSIAKLRLADLDETVESESSDDELATHARSSLLSKSVSTPMFKERRSSSRPRRPQTMMGTPTQQPFRFETLEMSKTAVKQGKHTSVRARRKSSSCVEGSFAGHSLLPQSDNAISFNASAEPLPPFVLDSVLAISDDESSSQGYRRQSRSKSRQATFVTVKLPTGEEKAVRVDSQSTASEVIRIASSGVDTDSKSTGICLWIYSEDRQSRRPLASDEAVWHALGLDSNRPTNRSIRLEPRLKHSGTGFDGYSALIQTNAAKPKKRFIFIRREGLDAYIACSKSMKKDKTVELGRSSNFDILIDTSSDSCIASLLPRAAEQPGSSHSLKFANASDCTAFCSQLWHLQQAISRS